jgi:hypothetical protein
MAAVDNDLHQVSTRPIIGFFSYLYAFCLDGLRLSYKSSNALDVNAFFG